jgi:uncharacterized Zn finger protein (UPF0148 family)
MMLEKEKIRFPCPKCGAELDFDAQQGELACKFCGHTANIPVTEQAIQEYDLEAALRAMVAAPQQLGYGDN